MKLAIFLLAMISSVVAAKDMRVIYPRSQLTSVTGIREIIDRYCHDKELLFYYCTCKRDAVIAFAVDNHRKAYSILVFGEIQTIELRSNNSILDKSKHYHQEQIFLVDDHLFGEADSVSEELLSSFTIGGWFSAELMNQPGFRLKVLLAKGNPVRFRVSSAKGDARFSVRDPFEPRDHSKSKR